MLFASSVMEYNREQPFRQCWPTQLQFSQQLSLSSMSFCEAIVSSSLMTFIMAAADISILMLPPA